MRAKQPRPPDLRKPSGPYLLTNEQRRAMPVAYIVLTEPQRRALLALAFLDEAERFSRAVSGYPVREHETVRLSGREIARALWPDSIGWHKRSRRGSTAAGGALGATMPMKAGAVMSRLIDWGLVMRRDYGFALADRGRAYLAAHPGEHAVCPPHDPGRSDKSHLGNRYVDGFRCVRCGEHAVFTGLDS